MNSLLKYFFPFLAKEIVIGQKYVLEGHEYDFYPMIYIPKKLNKTNVLYDAYWAKYDDKHMIEGETSIDSFKAFYVPYDKSN